MTAYAERQLGVPRGTALFGGLIATAGLGLMIVQQPFLAFVAVFALALGVAILARPDLATFAVVFLVYTNAAAVAVKYHGMPYTIGIVIPALLVVPVAYYLYKKRPVIADLPMAAIFVFLLVQLVSTLAAEDKAFAWGQVTPFIFEGVAIYILVRNAVRTVEVLRLAVWALLLAGVFMSLVVIFQEATATYSKPYMGFGQVGRDWFIGKSANPRLSGPIGDPNYFAQILLTLVPVGLLRVWGEKTMLARLLAAGATGVIAFGLTLTFSRGAGVAFVVVLAMMTVFRYIRPYQLVTILLGIFILLNFVPAYKERVATLGSSLTGGADPESGADQSVQSRSTEMRAAGMVFLDHPLLGVGPGSFPLYYQEYAAKVGLEVHETTAAGRRAGEEARRESHNMLLSIAADLGLFGLLSFLLIVGLTFRGLNRARKRWLVSHPEAANLATTMMLAIAAYGVCGLFLTLAFERYFWLIVALAGSAAALDVGEEDEKKSTETEAAPPPLPVRAAVQSQTRRQGRSVETRPRPDRRPSPRQPVPQRAQPRVRSEPPILPPPLEAVPQPPAAPEPRPVPQTPVVEIDLVVTLAEAATGTIQLVEFPRSVRCPECFGVGSVLDRPCEACEGVGRVVEPAVVRVFIPPRATEGQRVPIANPVPIDGGGPLGHVVVRIQIPRRDRIVRYAASAGLLGSLGFLAFLLFFA